MTQSIKSFLSKNKTKKSTFIQREGKCHTLVCNVEWDLGETTNRNNGAFYFMCFKNLQQSARGHLLFNLLSVDICLSWMRKCNYKAFHFIFNVHVLQLAIGITASISS